MPIPDGISPPELADSAAGDPATLATPGQMPAGSAPMVVSPEPSSPVVAPGEPPAAMPAPTAPMQVAQPSPEMADPLTEAGDVVWYVRPASGGQFGPAGPEAMRSWIREGRVSGDCLVWREGWRDWREASAVFPRLGARKVEAPFGGIAPGEALHTTIAAARSNPARRRRRPKNTQAAVIILLIFALLILLAVFYWVLP